MLRVHESVRRMVLPGLDLYDFAVIIAFWHVERGLRRLHPLV